MIREEDLSDLYSLCVSRHNLVKMRSKSKIQLVSYIDRFFPELEDFFNKNLHINTVYQLIKKYPTPDDIKKVRIDKLTNFLDEASHGKFKKDKAVALKELAKQSVGLPKASFVLQAQLAVNQIELYSDQICEIGISVTNNLINFDPPSKVVAYAELDPVVYQSGQSSSE